LFLLEIERYGFFEAYTDILAIHEPIPITNNFQSYFLLHYQNMMYSMPWDGMNQNFSNC